MLNMTISQDVNFKKEAGREGWNSWIRSWKIAEMEKDIEERKNIAMLKT